MLMTYAKIVGKNKKTDRIHKEIFIHILVID